MDFTYSYAAEVRHGGDRWWPWTEESAVSSPLETLDEFARATLAEVSAAAFARAAGFARIGQWRSGAPAVRVTVWRGSLDPAAGDAGEHAVTATYLGLGRVDVSMQSWQDARPAWPAPWEPLLPVTASDPPQPFGPARPGGVKPRLRRRFFI